LGTTSIRLSYLPRLWQKRCHAIVARFLVLVLHRRAGKTEFAIMKLIDAAMQCRLDLPLFFYVCPLLKQARSVAWERLKSKCAPLIPYGAVEISESNLSVTFLHNKATIRLYGGDNPDAMRGVRLDGCVLDEVAQMKPEVWDDIIQPALSDREGWALFIGTPDGVNLFSDLYFRAANLPDWGRALYTVYDTDALNPTEVARLKATMSETSFSREFLCDFSAAGDDQLISLGDAEVAAHRMHKPGTMEHAPLLIGVDPARFGGDRSVIIKRRGLQAFTPVVYPGIDNMTLAGNIANLIEHEKPDATFIDVGNGAGVIDRLRQLGHDVIEVNFGGRSTSGRFVNKRTEMWWSIREWLAAGGAIPNILELKQELATPKYSFDVQNRICLESKDDIRKRLPKQGSPDIADALATTFAFPVSKRMPWATNSARHSVMDYDPVGGILHRQSAQEYDPLNFNR
jgi:hypothetical protein